MGTLKAPKKVPQTSPTPATWEAYKGIILELWYYRDLKLSVVMAQMSQRGFHATPRMYKAQFAEWQVCKNATRDDWLPGAKLIQTLQESGIANPQIKIHNKDRQLRDLRKWLRDHDESEDDFMTEARGWQGPTPDHIRACGPRTTSDNMPHSAPGSSSATATPFADTSVAYPESIEVDEDASAKSCLSDEVAGTVGALHHEGQGHQPGSTASGSKKQAPATGAMTHEAPMNSELTNMSELGTFPRVLGGDVDDMLQNTYGQTPPPVLSTIAAPNPILSYWYGAAHMRYVVGCELAAVYGYLRMHTTMNEWLNHASDGFRQMCAENQPIILLAASAMLTWLSIHVSDNVAGKVLAATLSVAQTVFGPQDPVTLTLNWMVLATNVERLRIHQIDTRTMRHIWTTTSQTLGDQHCHTMVVLYGLCFHLMAVDKKFAEAGEHLERLIATSTRVLGSAHVFTINILATLSRAQLRQGRVELALSTINRSLIAAPYGLNHPHRLELLLRKAILLWKLGRREETKELYKTVTRGRVATLGRHHNKTISAHNSLIDVAEESENWEAEKDELHRVLADPQMTVEDYESWWRDTFDAARREKGEGPSLGDESDE
ncbi:uncharacterized protein HMPREF1541_09096 [Cyphellophora europaea CBS 101466]|uniref:Clr5 domain-containing protein n=1 Tax=Cyphellophora europaea (strain CBS 101466) TaxID=1220924 RepID=W2S9E4_CYPE1|nr:uncharacterized protein HMPREF1541_09096 [Cyphellophora europaea CBS 101466]ETN45265.1 hypothetical protein HMPREF1541_09096 [Cyphellophora europaea CBS 101466]